MRSRIVRILLVLIVAAALATGFWYTVLRREPVPVTVFTVSRGRVEDTVTNSKAGTVRSRHRAMLSPEVGGRVVELSAREGATVGRGELLLRIADDEARAALELRKRALEAARATREESCLSAELARREHARYMRLHEQQVVSEELLDRMAGASDAATAGCSAARARVAEAESTLELARVMLSRTELHAPFGGIVAEVSAELGEWISPSPPGVPIPPVIELLDPASVYVSAPLDEVDLARVETGQPVRVTMDAHPGRAFTGRVVRVAPYVLDVEQHSRTVEIEVELDEHPATASFLPGSSADVEVILAVRDDVVRVPSYALIEGDRVLVFGDDSVLVSRPVEIGLSNWTFTEITSGLSKDERIVVSLDRAEVQEGARATIAGETDR